MPRQKARKIILLKTITRVDVKPLKLTDQTMFRVDNFQRFFFFDAINILRKTIFQGLHLYF